MEAWMERTDSGSSGTASYSFSLDLMFPLDFSFFLSSFPSWQSWREWGLSGFLWVLHRYYVVCPFFCWMKMFVVAALRGPLCRLNRWSVNTCGLGQLSKKSKPVLSSIAARRTAWESRDSIPRDLALSQFLHCLPLSKWPLNHLYYFIFLFIFFLRI